LSPEAQAANAAVEVRREKEKRSRLKNAEKQARFREGMKEAGYKRVTLWEPPGPSGAHGRVFLRTFMGVFCIQIFINPHA